MPLIGDSLKLVDFDIPLMRGIIFALKATVTLIVGYVILVGVLLLAG